MMAWSVIPLIALIGVIASVLVIESILFVEHRLKIDDPVGAISVHGVNGLFGVLAVGIFANGSYGAGWNGAPTEGVEGIIKGDWGQLGAQALGALVIWTVIFGLAPPSEVVGSPTKARVLGDGPGSDGDRGLCSVR